MVSSVQAVDSLVAFAGWDGGPLVTKDVLRLLDHWAGERIELEPVVRSSAERPAPATRWRIIDFKDGEL